VKTFTPFVSQVPTSACSLVVRPVVRSLGGCGGPCAGRGARDDRGGRAHPSRARAALEVAASSYVYDEGVPEQLRESTRRTLTRRPFDSFRREQQRAVGETRKQHPTAKRIPSPLKKLTCNSCLQSCSFAPRR
jgi:hypothetical protein